MNSNSQISDMVPMSLSQLFKKYDYILIPKIQRDYAHGRLDKKASDVRDGLLDAIFHNSETGQGISLDFIYGTSAKRKEKDGISESNCFIPLDGQQRLTTLFLIYLYNQKFHPDCECLKSEPQLKYETRRAAEDFCHQLVISPNWDLEMTHNYASISEYITDADWFMRYWMLDPTVSSMLTMLDAIHSRAKGSFIKNAERITFYYYDINEESLNEDLYVKMNSRGLPLTAFENAKASIDEMLKDNSYNSSCPFECFAKMEIPEIWREDFKSCWQYCIDRQFQELFWPKDIINDDGTIISVDCRILMFFVSVLTSHYASSASHDDEHLNNLLSLYLDNDNDYLSFSLLKYALDDSGSIVILARALCNIFLNKEILNDVCKPYWLETSQLDILGSPKSNSDYNLRSLQWAISMYNGDDYSSTSFKDWMHFIWNIIENSVSGKTEYESFCHLVFRLSPYSNDIYGYLRGFKSASQFQSVVSLFAKDQIEEEIVKSQLSLDEKWAKEIDIAEKTAFFHGDIRFLLCNSDGENWIYNKDYESFLKNLYNSIKYFSNNGLSKEYANDFIIAFIKRIRHWGHIVKNEIFSTSRSKWRQMSNSVCFVNIFQEILSKDSLSEVEFLDFADSTDLEYLPWANSIKHLLTESGILYDNDIVKENSQYRIRWSAPTYSFYYAYARDGYALDWVDSAYSVRFVRNSVLNKLADNKDIKIEGKSYSGFWWGWDIKLNYKGRKFIWDYSNKIHICDDAISPNKVSLKDINEASQVIDVMDSLIINNGN